MENYLITVCRPDPGTLAFYLNLQGRRFYLFSQPYTQGVHAYFRPGRHAAEIRSFHGWKQNKRLSKTIERIPGQVRYIVREVM